MERKMMTTDKNKRKAKMEGTKALFTLSLARNNLILSCWTRPLC